MSELEKTTLDVLKLGPRARNALEGAGVKTLSDLTALRRNDLLKKKNIGQQTLREITEALHRHGLYLTGSEAPTRLVPAQYTVVVEMSAEDALEPRIPTKVYVLPSGNLSLSTIDSFRKSAAKGGCQVRVFTVGDSGVEHVKWELEHYGATRLD